MAEESESQQLWDMHIGDWVADAQAENAARRQAVADYLESRQAYGSNRSLYAPEGRYQTGSEGVHFRHQLPTPRSQGRTRYRSHHQSAPRSRSYGSGRGAEVGGWRTTKDGMMRTGWSWWEFFAGFFGG